MKLSLLVPIYNEAPHLENVVQKLMSFDCPIEREWIFIDDCSGDESRNILRRLSSKYNFKLIEQTYNQGKGAAIIRGLHESTGDFVIIQDADYEYDPQEIPMLLQPLLDNKADVVFGSRFKKNAPQVHRTYHYFVNRLLTVLSNLFSGIYLSDMETCYKVYRSDLMKAMRLQSQRFGIEVELVAYTAKVRARIYELPISYFPRTRLQGKKIGWQDGVAALFHLVRFNFLITKEQAFSTIPPRYEDGPGQFVSR